MWRTGAAAVNAAVAAVNAAAAAVNAAAVAAAFSCFLCLRVELRGWESGACQWSSLVCRQHRATTIRTHQRHPNRMIPIVKALAAKETVTEVVITSVSRSIVGG